ncbi:hypothetical protein MTR67_038522 [Solanum verrucosum]|nr:hypothetical protein MTR67_038522 [Solanum verrucosum]
MDISPS